MNNVATYRRENLRRLIAEHGGPSAAAKAMGYRSASFLVQMAGPNPVRDVTEKTARSIEDALKMPQGSLDEEYEFPIPTMAPRLRSVAAAPSPVSTQLMSDLFLLIGQVCEAEKVDLSSVKFANIAALGMSDAAEHEGHLRPEHVKQLVRLAK